MKFRRLKKQATAAALALAMAASIWPSPAAAITLGQVDDFQDGTTQNWGVGQGGAQPVGNVANAGPLGFGDRALHMDAALYGVGKLLVTNAMQWTGDWTAAGVNQVTLDVRNPNAFELKLRIGIVGPGGVSMGGGGDTHVTDFISVPADNAWYTITFPVQASDFTAISNDDPAIALRNVTHVRILNNQAVTFVGTDGGQFYLDNIHALGPLPGDYNGNGTVDAADYVVWRKLNGQSGAGLAADGTGPSGTPDGVVDNLDYGFWRARFGNSQSGGGHNHGFGADIAIVPEPATARLCFAAIYALAAVYRRIDRSKEPAN